MYNNAFKNVFPFLNSASKAGSPPGTSKMYNRRGTQRNFGMTSKQSFEHGRHSKVNLMLPIMLKNSMKVPTEPILRMKLKDKLRQSQGLQL